MMSNVEIQIDVKLTCEKCNEELNFESNLDYNGLYLNIEVEPHKCNKE